MILRQPSAISSRNLYPPIYFTISFLSSTPLQNDFLQRMNPKGSELLDWGKKNDLFSKISMTPSRMYDQAMQR